MTPAHGAVRVLLFLRAADAQAIERGYHRISADLAGTPGLLGNELLRDVHESQCYVVLSMWESRDAFTAWEQGSTHRGSTAPLRAYQDVPSGRPFGVYEVAGRHDQGSVDASA